MCRDPCSVVPLRASPRSWTPLLRRRLRGCRCPLVGHQVRDDESRWEEEQAYTPTGTWLVLSTPFVHPPPHATRPGAAASIPRGCRTLAAPRIGPAVGVLRVEDEQAVSGASDATVEGDELLERTALVELGVVEASDHDVAGVLEAVGARRMLRCVRREVRERVIALDPALLRRGPDRLQPASILGSLPSAARDLVRGKTRTYQSSRLFPRINEPRRFYACSELTTARRVALRKILSAAGYEGRGLSWTVDPSSSDRMPGSGDLVHPDPSRTASRSGRWGVDRRRLSPHEPAPSRPPICRRDRGRSPGGLTPGVGSHLESLSTRKRLARHWRASGPQPLSASHRPPARGSLMAGTERPSSPP